MTYFVDVFSKSELKEKYRKLALACHPDKGGEVSVMQRINYEYSLLQKGFSTKPSSLMEVIPGHTVFVNSSACIVTEVEEKLFKATSLQSRRQAYFDKITGYGLFNFKIRASVFSN